MTSFLDGLLSGKSSYTKTTATATMPAVSANVLVAVADTSWAAAGAPVYVAGAGAFTIAAVNGATQLSLTNTGAVGNIAPGQTIPSGALLTPSGVPGQNGASGTGHPPVKCVQVQALPTGSYNSGMKTYTASANGAIAASVFDSPVAALAVNDRIEVNSQGVAATLNGVYQITALGDASHPFAMTRVTDLNTSAGFVGGVAYDVQDGSTLAGTRRQLYTQGAITLDTTALTFGPVVSRAVLEIDLSQPPYNIRDYHSYSEWLAAGGIDYGRALDLFCYTYRNVGQAVRGRLPSSNGGLIHIIEPFSHYGNVSIVGAGFQGQSCIDFGDSGGFACTAAEVGPDLTLDYYPQISGVAVDTATNATALSTYRDAQGNTNKQYYWHLGEDGGLLINDWTAFEMRMLVRFDQLNVDAPISHIVSCRGRRTAGDTNDYAVNAFTGSLFAVFLNDGVSPTLSARMRLTDTTAGVYGATVHTGSGTGTVTGDGTVKPTEDAPNFTIRIETGGTAGVAGVKVSWAIDGQRFCAPVALGTATSLVIPNGTGEVNEFDQPFSAKVNFSGALVAGDTYKIPCSGVNQNISLTSSTVVDTSHNYDVLLQYRGGKVYFYVSVAGGTLDSGASTTGTTATGVLRQRYWENTIFGRPMNSAAGEASVDYNGARLWLGSIRFLNASVSAPGSTVTTIGAGVAGQKLHWCPNSGDLRKDAGGVLRRRYRAYTEIGRGYGWFVPRSAITGLQIAGGGFENLEFRSGTDPSQRASGLRTSAWRNRVFRSIAFTGGALGWNSVGPDFGSIDESLSFGTRFFGIAFKYFQGELNMSGTWNFANAQNPCYAQISTANIHQSGTAFCNTEQFTTRKVFLLDQLANSNFNNLVCDAENQISLQTGRELYRVSVLTGNSVKFRGNVSLAEVYSAITQVGGTGQLGLIEVDLQITQPGVVTGGVTTIGSVPPLSQVGSPLPPPVVIAPTAGFLLPQSFLTPLCDQPNAVQRQGIAGKTVLTDASGTVTVSPGMALKLAASTLTANRVYTLPVVDANGTALTTGTTQRVTIEDNGFTVTIANGGPAGGNATPTLPAHFVGSLTFRFDESRNWSLV